jgi:hypothetical protein
LSPSPKARGGGIISLESWGDHTEVRSAPRSSKVAVMTFRSEADVKAAEQAAARQ